MKTFNNDQLQGIKAFEPDGSNEMEGYKKYPLTSTSEAGTLFWKKTSSSIRVRYSYQTIEHDGLVSVQIEKSTQNFKTFLKILSNPMKALAA